MNSPSQSQRRHAYPGKVRIIGGRWRGRKLVIAPASELRPSADRVRETVFNWLAPSVEGARCLDLYAGTGAFGFEALSRGAHHASFVDRDARVIKTLKAQAAVLGASHLEFVCENAVSWLRTTAATPYDIVFLDPPYEQPLIMPTLEALLAGWLKAHAKVYVEGAAIPDLDALSAALCAVKRSRTKRTEFALLQATPQHE